jgi:large repetitive protein
MAINRRALRASDRTGGGRLSWFLLLTLSWVASALGTPNPERSVSYTNEVFAKIPWSIHVVKIDRSHPELRLCTTLGGGKVLGMGTVSEQLKALPSDSGKPLAAINGDFYEKAREYPGRPRDLQIRNGEVITHPAGHTCFWIDSKGAPQMTNIFSRFHVVWPGGKLTPFGMNVERTSDAAVLYTAVLGTNTHTLGGVEYTLERSPNCDWLPLRIGQTYMARVREVATSGNAALTPQTAVLSIGPGLASKVPSLKLGDTVELILETFPALSGVETAMGGGPALIQNGRVMSWKGWIHIPHPRTALGWNKRYIFLIEVDGRQLDVSLGMTLPQLAKYMRKLGCEQAMNLDGGGSATLWAFGAVRNSPSEGQERPAPNALVLVRRETALAKE